MSESSQLGIVLIGRNEGDRLARCLASVFEIPARIYVDSGSVDGSVALARRCGVTTIELSVPPPFTAARARNAGITQLLADHPNLEFIQMVDGDCELQPGWIESGLAALQGEPALAAVFGRLRERYPERSIYNALCDDEWNVPVGEAAGCGGNALFRVAALREVNFYNPAMIAGEDSELSMRLRKRGWRMRRLDAEMALHDAALISFRQWWNRTRRSGHGFGEMAALHPDARDPNWPRTVRGIVAWGAGMPVLFLISVLLALQVNSGWWIVAILAFIAWPFNMVRLARRQRQRGLAAKIAAESGALLMIGKVPQLQGLIGYYRDRLAGRASRLIEHKGATNL
jgi:glycosyltransferase involved in cell wall biosynthesis